jgi:hypothetical protein
LFILN